MIVENTSNMILSTLALIVAPSVFVGREAGPLVCWGSNAYGVLDAPDGLFTAVAAGMEHSLAIRLDGSVVCWGNNDEGQCNAPSGSFVEVAGGGSHSIARRSNGGVACWGENTNGQCNVLRGGL